MINRLQFLSFFLLFLGGSNFLFSQDMPTPFNEPPKWAKSAIWYQLFVERFYSSQEANNPKIENITTPFLKQTAPEGWSVTPWTGNWHEQEDWAKKTGKSFNEMLQYRRYGGDLQGVLDKLDYLQDLGITALFLNPINDAPSLHKYDARCYHHVDVNFGPDPVGDNALIASENPNDPKTWKWTAADKLFLKLVEEVHKRGMKIIMDYSWNHTGTTFWAFEDIVKNQEKSPYKDWYNINSFDKPNTTENEFSYQAWLNFSSLPEIKKVNLTTPRKIGFPYEGDINGGAKQHIFDVTRRWLAPNGDKSKGIDGFRLDVADHIGLVFWRDFRKFVREIQPDAYLVGEIWWEEWPDKLMNPVPYTQGDVFDAVMFYQAYRPARYFFAKTDFDLDAKAFKDSLEREWNRLSKANRYAMMNVSSSHDAPRLLTDFANPNKYKFQANTHDNPDYNIGKPDEESYQRLHLYLVHLFTTIGAPQIWNGEEMGMWGGDDPHCRKPLWWKEFSFEKEVQIHPKTGKTSSYEVGFDEKQYDRYKKLIQIRKENPVLIDGDIEFLPTKGKMLAYKRYDKKDEIIVIFNLENKKKAFNLPEKHKYIDLLARQNLKGGTHYFAPMRAVVLKEIK